MARESGFQTVHAVPLRLRDEVIGAMNVFDASLHEMTMTESNLLRAFADAATIGILQERTVKQQSDLSIQLQGALNSRIAVEQAKGIVAERLKVDMDTAFGMIRSHARNHGTLLSAVAERFGSGLAQCGRARFAIEGAQRGAAGGVCLTDRLRTMIGFLPETQRSWASVQSTAARTASCPFGSNACPMSWARTT